MGMAAGLHEFSASEPSVADIYTFCSLLTLAQAQEIAANARSWVLYTRSLDEDEAALLATVIEGAARSRLKP